MARHGRRAGAAAIEHEIVALGFYQHGLIERRVERLRAPVAQGIAKQLGVTAVQQSSAFPNADVSVVLGADYTG